MMNEKKMEAIRKRIADEDSAVTVMEKTGITQKDLRVGSVLEDVNGYRHTVKRFNGIFTITKYNEDGCGELWLVDSHLQYEKLIQY